MRELTLLLYAFFVLDSLPCYLYLMHLCWYSMFFPLLILFIFLSCFCFDSVCLGYVLQVGLCLIYIMDALKDCVHFCCCRF